MAAMGFLKRIKEIATSKRKANPEYALREPQDQASAHEPAPALDRIAASGDERGTPEEFSARARRERLNSLTPREREVYGHLIRGRKLREIAALLGVSYPTVNFHCQGLYRKLCVNTRTQLILQYALLENGGATKACEETPN